MKYFAMAASTIVMSAGNAVAFQTTQGDESVAELRTLVKQLQNQVDELKAQNDDNWLTQQRAEEIKGLVQDVLADADTRATLLQSGATAGWDKGFFLASADGNFKLNIGGQLQVRYVYNIQNDSPTDDDRSGFEVRRAKLILKGHIVDPSWGYELQIGAGNNGAFAVDDAGWIQKDFGNGWKVRVGQMKAPFLREEVVSSTRLFAVERSLVNTFFTAGTVQGAMVLWEGDQLHLYGMAHDGNNSKNTPWSTEDTEGLALSGRAEWLAFGEWKNIADYDSFKDEGSSLLIGAAVNWSKSEFGTGDGVIIPGPGGVPSDTTPNDREVNNLGLTADVTWELGGASIAGAIMYRRLETDATGATADQIGFLIRGGLFVTEEWELYAQYEWADQDTAGLADLSVATVGVTKFWAKHNLKWQSDVGYGFDTITSTLASDSAGWRTDTTGEDGQIVVRSQIQLLF